MNGLKRIRKCAGLSQESAAEVFGVPLNTWRGWEQRKHLPKDKAMLKRISDYFDVSIEALLGYEITDCARSDLGDSAKMNDSFACGSVDFDIAIDEFLLMQDIDTEPPNPSEVLRNHPGSFFIKVTGDSMNRVLPSGCYALVSPNIEKLSDGTVCVVCVNGEPATIKRVHHITNGFMLAPDSYNKEHEPVIYNYDIEGTPIVTVIGEVIWFIPPFGSRL